MDSEQTCGKGLAEQSALPQKMSSLLAALADNLERHIPGLDLSDPNSQREKAAYESLLRQFREASARLRKAAEEMASYRDLPMGAHDMAALSSPQVSEAFERFVSEEEELFALVQRRVSEDLAMINALRALRGTPESSDHAK